MEQPNGAGARQQARQQARQLAVVTGASSGIGRELAKLFAGRGYDLVVAAEDAGVHDAAAELQRLGAAVDAVQVDLATPEGVEQLAARAGGGRSVDALVLNAGVGLGGAFVDQPLDRVLGLVDLNVRSVVHLAHRLLPAMVARGGGRVLVTSSIAALAPGAYSAVYNASKAFEHSWAEAVRAELKDSGVTVTSLQPGGTETNFMRRAGLEGTKLGQSEKDDAAEVARDGFEAMMAGRDHVVAGSLKNKVQAVLSEIVPEATKAEQHGKMAKPGSAHK